MRGKDFQLFNIKKINWSARAILSDCN